MHPFMFYCVYIDWEESIMKIGEVMRKVKSYKS